MRISFVRHPGYIASYIHCIDIVSHTSEFYVFDNPILMSYILVYLFYWYCEHYNRILFIWHPGYIAGHLLYWYCEHYNRILFIWHPGYIASHLFYRYCESHVGIVCVRQPHRDELYCRTFIVLILWALQQDFIYWTPWLHFITFVFSILWDINFFLFVRPHIMMGYNESHILYWYRESYNVI